MAELINTPLRRDGALQAYYQLENANDYFGTYNLTNGGATFIPAKYKNGANVDLGNLFVNSNLTITDGNITMCSWVKFLNLPSVNIFTLMHQQNNPTKTSFDLNYKLVSSVLKLNVHYDRKSIASYDVDYAISLSTNVWYHIGFTYDTSIIKLYLNGLQVSSLSQAYGNGTGTINNNLYLGSTDSGQAASVVMDDAAIFSRALIQAEMNLLASLPPTTGMLL